MANSRIMHTLTAPPNLPQLRLIVAGYGWIDETWQFPGLISAHYRVYLSDRQGAELVIGSKRYPLTAGRVHLVPAWIAIDYICHKPVQQYYLHFEVVGLSADAARQWMPEPISFPAMEWAMDCWLGDEPQRAMRLRALLWWAMAETVEVLGPPIAHDVTESSRITPALKLIESQLHRSLTVDELAAQCSLSAGQFSRRFRALVGVPPGQFLLERRVTRAAELLADSDLSIDEIADRCGFADRFHLTKVFSQRMRVPPAAYRGTQRRMQ